MFVQFCNQLDLSQINISMTNFSQTVLFVLMEFLYKTDIKNHDVLELF